MDELRARLPELPDARRARYMQSFALNAYDAEQLSTDAVAAELFEATVGAGADAKKAANLILNDVARARPESSALSATDLAPRLAKLIAHGRLGRR